jgi:hypothetical protein
MNADSLDSRIRHAITQVVETSPPPVPLEDLVALRPRAVTRRRVVVGTVVGAALVAAIVVFAAVIVARDGSRVGPTGSPNRPPRIAAPASPSTTGSPSTSHSATPHTSRLGESHHARPQS